MPRRPLRPTDIADEDPVEPMSPFELGVAAAELQELGAALVKLSEPDLQALELEEPLRDAVVEARRLTQYKALERQIQFIGKIMRGVDPAPIRAALERISHGDSAQKRNFATADAWRLRLLEPGDDALNELLTAHPTLDRQQLRQLVRQMRKQPAGRHAQELLRLLRAL